MGVSRRFLGPAVSTLLAFGLVESIAAQTLAVGDPLEEYARVLQILGKVEFGSFTVRPMASAALRVDSVGHPWEGRTTLAVPGDPRRIVLQALPSNLRMYANSRFPSGRNDGAVWQGRGLTVKVGGGQAVTAASYFLPHPVEVRQYLTLLASYWEDHA